MSRKPWCVFDLANKTTQISKLETESIAADALQEFHRLLGVIPDFARLYVTEVLDFLGRSHRDRFNQPWYSDRHQLYLSLYEQGVESLNCNPANIHKAAMTQAKDDPWDALSLLALLLHFELYDQAAATAREIAAAQPHRR